MEVWAEGVASSVRVHARGQVCTVKYVHCQVCMRAGVQLSSMFTVKFVQLIHASRCALLSYVHCQVCSQVSCSQVPCAVDAGAAKRSAPIDQCQCHGSDAGAPKGISSSVALLHCTR